MDTKREMHLNIGNVAFLSGIAVIGCLLGFLFNGVMMRRIEVVVHFFSSARSGITVDELLRLLPTESIVPECSKPHDAKALIFAWSCSHRPPDYVEVLFDQDAVASSSLITSDARVEKSQIKAYLTGIQKSWLFPLVDTVSIVCALESMALLLLWAFGLLIHRQSHTLFLKWSCVLLVMVSVASLQSRVPVILLEAISGTHQAMWVTDKHDND
jgi:hypothetical protein